MKSGDGYAGLPGKLWQLLASDLKLQVELREADTVAHWNGSTKYGFALRPAVR